MTLILKILGRATPQQITLFGGSGTGSSSGLDVQFVTVGARIYEKAKPAGIGNEIPTEWFLKDVSLNKRSDKP